MLQTVIFPRPEFSKKELGYIRLGGKVPVEPGLVKDASGKCSQGWYHLVDGGYVCARYATLDIKSPQIRLGITPPNLEDVLPYKYAHNSAHGTPLYRSVPSREEMLRYEPYLDAAKKAKRKADKADKEDALADKPDEARQARRARGRYASREGRQRLARSPRPSRWGSSISRTGAPRSPTRRRSRGGSSPTTRPSPSTSSSTTSRRTPTARWPSAW